MRRFLAILVAALVCVAGAAPAAAKKLGNVIGGLYGGNGIQLVDARGVEAPEFETSSLASLSDLDAAIAGSLRMPSFSGSSTRFLFDLERGVPIVREEQTASLYAENALTLGRGRLDVSLSYTRIDFKRLDGEPLDDLEFELPSSDLNGDGVIGPRRGATDLQKLIQNVELDTIKLDLDVDLEHEIFALAGTYGVLPDLDVQVVIPIVRAHIEASATAAIQRSPQANPVISERLHSFDTPGAESPTSSDSETAAGIGDVVLRAKYNFFRDEARWPALTVRGQIKLPTGDQDNLLGTGHTDFQGMLVASREYGRIAPHFNVAYELSTGPSAFDNLQYVVGSDFRISPALTAALDIVGRWSPNGQDIGEHQIDGAVSVKARLRNQLYLSGGASIPINRDVGLRPDFSWTLRLEYVFEALR